MGQKSFSPNSKYSFTFPLCHTVMLIKKKKTNNKKKKKEN